MAGTPSHGPLRWLIAALVCAALGCSDPAPAAPTTAGDEEVARPQNPGAAAEIPDRIERGALGQGRWRRAAGEPALDLEQRELVESLEALGYLRGSRASTGAGVTRHEPARSQPGLNFYTSGHAPEAVLMDMEGRVLHRWHADFRSIWPDDEASDSNENTQWWRRAHLFDDGDVLVVFEGLGIARLDRDSKLRWARRNSAHHDLAVRDDGSIWLLTRLAHLVPRIDPKYPILEDFLTLLDADGRELRSFSLLAAFERSEYASLWESAALRRGDVFHTNTVEIIGGGGERAPAFAPGRLLISVLQLDAIAVVDPVSERVVWARRGDFRQQHDPKLLEDGRILLFDNGGPRLLYRRGLPQLDRAGRLLYEEAEGPLRSRILELDPKSLVPSWRYTGSDAEPFFSRSCGTAQRLANGNTLITESDGGRAFEVTREQEIVWEFRNPHRAGPAGEFVATLTEVLRLPVDFGAEWLATSPGEPGAPVKLRR